MEENTIYASDNRSNIRLIEDEFTHARVRAARRHREYQIRRAKMRLEILPGIAATTLIVFLLGLIKAVWPII